MPRPIRIPFHSSQKPQNSRAGLSLLEVIIATVILAVSATLLVRLIGAGDRNAQRADQRITAQMICQNKMDEIVASIEPLESIEPTASPYYPEWYWSVSIDDLNSKNDTTVNRLSLVEVGVFFRTKRRRDWKFRSIGFASRAAHLCVATGDSHSQTRRNKHLTDFVREVFSEPMESQARIHPTGIVDRVDTRDDADDALLVTLFHFRAT